ncbi:protein translocase subunit SecD [bacterium]|nr:MAG: protein translocase subunit SecD [bacterium]
MRSRSYLFLLIVLVLGIASGIGYASLKYRLGLDIQGGVRFTYQMDTSKLKGDQRTQIPVMQNKLVSIMGQRAVGPLGVTEPTVTKKGLDQIVVELPGLKGSSAKAQEVMGTSARIEFYGATNVVNPVDSNRPYSVADRGNRSEIGESFIPKFGDSTPINYTLPGGKLDPRYQAIIKQWGEPVIVGEDLARAEAQLHGNQTVIGLEFSPEGARKMEQWTRNHPRENLAAVLDNKVLSIAPLEEGAVISSSGIITGNFPEGYPARISEILNSGSLPVDLKLLSAEQVDATIGQDALKRMVMAGAVSFGLIGLYLIAYYAFPGVIALLALCLYVLFTLTVMKLIGATFSLAGIAGFILSVGMAVDANILVFERFKEEMKAGKTLAGGIELGFKRAFTAILDSNICTILTSFVLMYYGTGPVKGFATTLIIGVLISFFTAVTVTRSLLMFFVGSGIASNPKLYAVDRDWFGKLLRGANDEKPLRIVETSKKWFGISIATMVIAIPFFFMGGFKPNVEFRGGYEAVFASNGDVSSAALTEKLERAGLKGGNVKLATVDKAGGGSERLAYITLPPLDQLKGSNEQNISTIAQAAGLSASDSRGFTQIGPAVQAETTRNAILGVVASSALIVLFLAFRFGTGVGGFGVGLRFGGSAIVALLHDVIVVFGLAAIVGYFAGWEVSALFLTAMLTIIGFSTHDTIVIFDRIRENLHKSKGKEEIGHLIDKSITQSFARSINTSSTVIVTLAILAVYGTTTPDLKFFVVAMLIGILSGTYSSIYNASPILYLVDKWAMKRGGEKVGLQYLAKSDAERARIVQTQTQVADVVGSSGRSYGQVRRRANQQPKGSHEIED